MTDSANICSKCATNYFMTSSNDCANAMYQILLKLYFLNYNLNSKLYIF